MGLGRPGARPGRGHPGHPKQVELQANGLKTRPLDQGVTLVRATAVLLVCQTLLWIWSPGARAAESGVATVKAGALELTWSAAGRVVGVDCGGAEVTGRGVTASGFSLRDCGSQKTYEPVSGRLTAIGDGVQFEGGNQAQTLAVSARCTAEDDWIAVRAEVQNLSETDRAVSLRFALPVACTGWKWAARLHRSEPLLAGREAHLGTATPLGTGHLALRPVAAVSDERRTLGLVMPVDFIGQYDFCADVDQELFSVAVDFAMTRYSPRFFKSVKIELYVDGEADGWGLRSVLDRYYATRPELFARHTEAAGGWFAWGDILRQPPPVCDYGLKFHEQPESEDGYRHDAALGIRVYPYIEPFMYQMCLGDQPEDERPTREFVLKRLEAWAKPETTGRLPSGGFRTQETLEKICRAIRRYGPHDPSGEPIIGAIGQYNWISGSKWAAQFPLDLAPAIPDGAGQDRLDHVRTHLMSQPHLNGIYLDSMANHFSRVCYPKENLEYATYPPLFDRRTLQPCSMVAFAAWEWVDALWDMLPPQKRELLPNLYGQITPIPWHRLTVMGKEHRLEPAGPLMQQYRTMGYRKVVTQLPATNWKHTLTSWQRFDPDRVHHLRLRLDKDTYRLELDDQRIGEGLHECSFGWAYVALGVYSGHRGRGDVCWWDNLRAYRAP
jgi:hypothetical protein